MTPEERDRLTRVETEMSNVKTDITEMKADVKSILETLNQAKGGWRSLMWVAGISGTAGSVVTACIAKFTPFLGTIPR